MARLLCRLLSYNEFQFYGFHLNKTKQLDTALALVVLKYKLRLKTNALNYKVSVNL